MAIDPELIYIEILETVLMATLDPDLWKSALQNWRSSPAISTRHFCSTIKAMRTC